LRNKAAKKLQNYLLLVGKLQETLNLRINRYADRNASYASLADELADLGSQISSIKSSLYEDNTLLLGLYFSCI
jgi:hypothetical protein